MSKLALGIVRDQMEMQQKNFSSSIYLFSV